MNVSLGMEYFRICEKIVDDLLLMRIKPNPVMGIMTQYLAVHSANFSDPQAFNMALNYGTFDFNYIHNYFKESVVPIAGIKANGNEDNGTAYLIGENRFVTAAHYVDGLERWNLLKPDSAHLYLARGVVC